MIDALSYKWLQRNWEQPSVGERFYRKMMPLGRALRSAWERICAAQQAMRSRAERRSLRVTESISLGEKRSVYLIEVDGQRLLLGASGAGVTLLSHLNGERERQLRAVKELMFADVMETCAAAKVSKRKPRAASAAEEGG